MHKIPVGVLGATGMVGQQYLALLANHPWFEVQYVAASPRSAGKPYKEAVAGRRHIPAVIAARTENLTVEDATDMSSAEKAAAQGNCAFVFSALDMSKQEIAALERAYAAAGIPVISNASAHRATSNVPMIIPEVNPHHCAIIPMQQAAHGWNKGFIAVKPNCSIQSYTTPLFALINAGYAIKRAVISTMQAVSGAGYPGVASLDIIDNVIPYINGEEEKSEWEPLKILGAIKDGRIIQAEEPLISAHCNRVPVLDGHTACVSIEFGSKKPSLEAVHALFSSFRALPQELNLPSAPQYPIIVRAEPNRPQPRFDRDSDKAMAVTVGRIRPCPVFDIRFVGLHHNTVRGAAGGAILSAELLKVKGFIG
ncbi:aspartate-semialdehyde dehydrogenase [Pillotina sp. SPG140]|jgi:aspartate-semialdehyde dehydrogenase